MKSLGTHLKKTGTTKSKVVVIGLDGSSWDLVRPLIDNKTLPALGRLMAAGAYGELQSTQPAHSAPAWTTFATGVHPTQHGCLDFLTVQRNIDDLSLIDSTAFPQESIYEAMVRHARRPILINLPNTYPPRLSEKYITITSLMTRGDQCIFPAGLKNKYPSLRKYRLSPNPRLRMRDNFDAYVNDLCTLEQDRIAGAKDLFMGEEWDFFFYLCSGTDWVSHVIYDKALEQHYEPAIRMWKIMDEFIGWVDAHRDSETTLIVMSDHGFKTYKRIFYVNRWLENQGYLTTRSGRGSFQQEHTQLSKAIGQAQRKRKQLTVGKGLRALLAKSRAVERAAKWIYFKVIKRFIPISVNFNVQLDIPKTQVAFPRGSMATMLYVNDSGRFREGVVNPEERTKLAQRIARELMDLRDHAQRPVLQKVHTKEELYGGEGLPNSPDLFLQAGEYYLSGSLHSASLFESATKNYHDERGMIIVDGPEISPGMLSQAHINQLAPTIMQLMSLPLLNQFVAKPLPVLNAASSRAQIQRESAPRSNELDSILDQILV